MIIYLVKLKNNENIINKEINFSKYIILKMLQNKDMKFSTLAS